MSDEKLIRIFDHNTCLTARQVKGYVSGSMVHEESHAIEAHLLNCPLCSEAVEGVRANRINGGIEGMLAITPDFLEGHQGFKLDKAPQVPLSLPKTKIKSTLNTDTGKKEQKKVGTPQLWRTVSIAATVVIAGGLFWFIQKNRNSITDAKVAQNVTVADEVVNEPATQPAPVALADSYANDTSLYADATTFKDTAVIGTNNAITDSRIDDAAKKLQADKAKELLAKKDTSKGRLKGDASRTVAAAKRTASPVTTSGGSGISKDYNNVAAADEIAIVKAPNRDQAAPVTTAPTKPATADELYDQQKYNQALTKYKQEINTSDGKDKEDAKLGAAKCYIALGDNKQAERLLRGMLYDNSKRKRQAKKLLKSIGADDE